MLVFILTAVGTGNAALSLPGHIATSCFWFLAVSVSSPPPNFFLLSLSQLYCTVIMTCSWLLSAQQVHRHHRRQHQIDIWEGFTGFFGVYWSYLGNKSARNCLLIASAKSGKSLIHSLHSSSVILQRYIPHQSLWWKLWQLKICSHSVKMRNAK